MAIYDYKAKKPDGSAVTGAVEAPSENVATEVLAEKDLIVLSLTERRKGFLAGLSIGMLNRVGRKDVVVFARQLAVMISATVPIVQAIRILVRQTENMSFKIVISEIADEVEGGAKLSATLARYPRIFGDFFIHMVRSGETTGKLDETLNYLADEQEKDYDLISKIRGAMIYPVFILGALIVVAVLMMIFVIPKLTGVLQESGAKLPFATRILIGTSTFMATYWWLLVLLVIAGVVAFRLAMRTEQGKDAFDAFKLRVPVFGIIFQKIYITRFSRSLSTLIVSGIPLTRSLEIVADVIGNRVYKKLVLETIQEVEAGNSVATVFERTKVVPPMLSQMLIVGEQTGKLDSILDKLANFFGKELENLVMNLVALIEPFVIVLLGVAVAGMVMGILLPMYNLSSAIS